MKSKLKKFVSGAMIALTLSVNTLSIPASAYSATRTIDNDSIASGYGNTNGGNAYSYLKANSLYNGDARIASSSKSSCSYYWKYPSMGANATSCRCTIKVYLNHANFTDPSAAYYVQLSNTQSNRVGYLNQEKAPAGWISVAKTLSPLPEGSYYTSKHAFVEPSGTKGKNTGADAIQVLLSS